MKNKLQRYFPIIRTRKEILNELRDNDEYGVNLKAGKKRIKKNILIFVQV